MFTMNTVSYISSLILRKDYISLRIKYFYNKNIDFISKFDNHNNI